MNNYCTKCGKKLENKNLFCNECETPVVDLPVDYVYKSPEKKRKQKKILTIVVSILGSILALVLLISLAYVIKVGYLNKNYVEKYIEKNYPNEKYSIDYIGSGKCIVDMYSHACGTNYEYLSVTECRSYYYNVNLSEEELTITVFKKDGKYSVVEGQDINGEDIEEDE